MKYPQLKLCMIALCAAIMMVGCSDNLSGVGESIQPDADKVKARTDSISVNFSTIGTPTVYSNTLVTLLGEINDLTYGNFKASFINKLRHARGFKFAHEPIDKKIDSVRLRINYSRWAGDSTALLKAAVYKLDKPVTSNSYSQQDLSDFISEKNFLGTMPYSAATGKINSNQNVRYVDVPINKELGQKIYNLSVASPASFNTQEAFERDVLQGLLVTTSTGSGNVLSVYGVELWVYYSYEGMTVDKDGKPTKGKLSAAEIFVNTKEQIMVNGFDNSDVSHLLEPDDKFAYIKSPAGVVTKVTISKEELQKAFDRRGQYNLQRDQVINEAQFKVNADQPDFQKTGLIPPPYLLMVAADSAKIYFEKNYTELQKPEDSFLSSQYSIVSRHYNFSNISPLIQKHIQKHGKYQSDGSIVVDKDLEALLVPVQRLSSRDQNVGGEKTTELNNYLFPSAVKLQTTGANRRIGIISTQFVN